MNESAPPIPGVDDRGLQVYTTASGNLSAFLEPQLSITTPGVVARFLDYSVVALPANGTLVDSQGAPVVLNGALADNRVTYTPNSAFVGPDSFQFRVYDFASDTSATATVNVFVQTAVGFGSCLEEKNFCEQGR